MCAGFEAVRGTTKRDRHPQGVPVRESASPCEVSRGETARLWCEPNSRELRKWKAKSDQSATLKLLVRASGFDSDGVTRKKKITPSELDGVIFLVKQTFFICLDC